MSERVLYSACLLGVRCAFDGCDRRAKLPRGFPAAGEIPVPVCPEQLGGLPTPRVPAEIIGGTGFDVLDGSAGVFSRKGRDVTDAFLRGAREAVRVARITGCERAVLAEGSPSCGTDWHYDGSFSGRRVRGPGTTAAALVRAGLEVAAPKEVPGSAGKNEPSRTRS